MHARAIAVSVVTAVGLAALAASLPSHAQGALRPVEARIVNTPSQPVPVSIVSSAAPATAMCRIDFAGGNLLPVTRSATSFPIAELNCPAGVSRLDVHRVVASAGQVPSAEAPVHFNLVIGLGPVGPGGPFPIDTPIATLSSGTPDLSLARPVRVDKSAAVLVLAQETCSSGLPTVSVRCLGTVFLIGTPVN